MEILNHYINKEVSLLKVQEGEVKLGKSDKAKTYDFLGRYIVGEIVDGNIVSFNRYNPVGWSIDNTNVSYDRVNENSLAYFPKENLMKQVYWKIIYDVLPFLNNLLEVHIGSEHDDLLNMFLLNEDMLQPQENGLSAQESIVKHVTDGFKEEGLTLDIGEIKNMLTLEKFIKEKKSKDIDLMFALDNCYDIVGSYCAVVEQELYESSIKRVFKYVNDILNKHVKDYTKTFKYLTMFKEYSCKMGNEKYATLNKAEVIPMTMDFDAKLLEEQQALWVLSIEGGDPEFIAKEKERKKSKSASSGGGNGTAPKRRI